jgi:catechol 2,3-dioxygenase-like lactoylglutathione lyase family enzyme
MARFRYIVTDVDQAVTFYTSNLGFSLEKNFAPAVAILQREDLELVVSGPKASASRPMTDGSKPVSGGWNRIMITVDDLAGFVLKLREDGVKFRNEIVVGPGGSQILCDDPSGNPIELFQPA